MGLEHWLCNYATCKNTRDRMLAFGVSCLHFDHGGPLPRRSRRFESRRSLNVPVRCLLALFLPFCLYFFILQGDGKTRAKFWSTVEDSFVSFSPSFFLHKLLNRFLPSAVSSHYPPTLLLRLLHHSLLTFPPSRHCRLPHATAFLCQEPGEALLALSSVQVTGSVPDGAHANKKPWVMA